MTGQYIFIYYYFFLFQKFFGTIRQAAGCNDHPSCPTFLQLYKLLSLYNVIRPPKYGNCTVSDVTLPSIVITLDDIKEAYGKKSAGMFSTHQEELRQKLDTILELGDWEVDDIFKPNLDHDYALTPKLECISYYMTGFLFHS